MESNNICKLEALPIPLWNGELHSLIFLRFDCTQSAHSRDEWIKALMSANA